MPFGKKRITYSSRSTHAARVAHAKGEKAFRTYDTSYIRPRKSKAPMIIIAIIVALGIIIGAAFLVVMFMNNDATPSLPEGEEAVITVNSGESAQSIAKTLKDAGLVGSTDSFLKVLKSQGAETSLIPGTYQFAGGTSVDEIVAALCIGPEATAIKLVIPEGMTREDTALTVERATQGRISATSFLTASSDASRWVSTYSFLQSAGTNSLEGFLFPKTYSVTAADGAEEVVDMMLSQFETETASLSFSYPESRNLNLYQAVTLASIVEKESSTDTMPMVASVFYNRLGSDRPYLESDATTAFEVGHDPTAEEVHANTPYSTYSHTGLPPTPICSPSHAALQAICDPASTNYMFFYFYPNDVGQVAYDFSETYEEHQAAIAAHPQ